MMYITYNQMKISVNVALLKSRIKSIVIWILKTIRTTAIISGIFLLLGTAGASDLNDIYFDDEPNGKDGMLLFAKGYRDMNELINAILKYSDTVKDELWKLYHVAKTKIKGA